MDPLVATVSHSLGKDEVIRRLKPALGRAVQMFPVLNLEQEQWSGDRMDFRVKAFGQFASGNVLVGENDVRSEVFLPWLLAKFTDAARESITLRTKILLDKK